MDHGGSISLIVQLYHSKVPLIKRSGKRIVLQDQGNKIQS
jgi:hypothetical protein